MSSLVSVRSRSLLRLLLWGGLALASPWAAAAELASVKVELRVMPVTWPAEGTVEAVRQATIAAQVAGRVVEMKVDAGERVRAGQILLRIDGRESGQVEAAAQARSVGAQADLANARAAYERTQRLFTRNFVSQAAVDQAEAVYKSAQAQADGAKAGAAQAGTVLGFATVTAPFAGVVAQRYAELGEMAAPGRPLLSIYAPGSLRVVASVPQYKLAALRQQARARIEFPDTGRWVEGGKLEILPTVDSQTHTLRVRVSLPAANDALPGAYARVHFTVASAQRLVIPQSAVLRRGEVSGVYVLDAQGLPSLRQVRLGEVLADGLVEVLAGVAVGESVAKDPVQAGIRLKQGAS